MSSQLLVFSKLCTMNTLLHIFLLLFQLCHSLRNVALGDRILGLIKIYYHGWLSMMTSSEGPLFCLASGPPTLNPPLPITCLSKQCFSIWVAFNQFGKLKTSSVYSAVFRILHLAIDSFKPVDSSRKVFLQKILTFGATCLWQHWKVFENTTMAKISVCQKSLEFTFWFGNIHFKGFC